MKGIISSVLDEIGYTPSSEKCKETVNSTVIKLNCKRSYIKKEHICFECGSTLERKAREVIVNSESEEAKNYDFYFVDSYLCGNVRFIILYFRCPKCGKVYEVRDYIKMENAKKKEYYKEKWRKIFEK